MFPVRNYLNSPDDLRCGKKVTRKKFIISPLWQFLEKVRIFCCPRLNLIRKPSREIDIQSVFFNPFSDSSKSELKKEREASSSSQNLWKSKEKRDDGRLPITRSQTVSAFSPRREKDNGGKRRSLISTPTTSTSVPSSPEHLAAKDPAGFAIPPLKLSHFSTSNPVEVSRPLTPEEHEQHREYFKTFGQLFDLDGKDKEKVSKVPESGKGAESKVTRDSSRGQRSHRGESRRIKGEENTKMSDKQAREINRSKSMNALVVDGPRSTLQLKLFIFIPSPSTLSPCFRNFLTCD